MWFHRPVVCGSSSGLPLQKEAVRHVPGLCGQWFGLLPDSQMARVSVSFLSLAILFRSLTGSLSFFLFLLYPPPPLPSQMKTFPLVNRGRKSRVEDTTESQKNMSLCGRGMLMIGCKYAVEEALKTATALNKWAHLTSTMPLLFLLQCMLAAC